MPFPTRIGDKTFGHGSHGEDCCSHAFSGFHSQGSLTVLIENIPVSRLSDKGVHYCPHCSTNFNMESVITVLYENKPSHCINHQVNEVCGIGRSVTSCNTVIDGK